MRNYFLKNGLYLSEEKANQNIGFKSHDNKQQEDGIHFVMQHNADKHRY